MTGEAKKAAPREKLVRYGKDRYRLLERSYINGAVREPGEEIYLPVGIEPGKNLEKVGGSDASPDPVDNNAAFLSRTVPQITDDLAGASDDELEAYLNAERGDKGRVGVIEAIEKEQTRRLEEATK